MMATHVMIAKILPGILCRTKAPMPARMQPPTAIGTYQATTYIGPAPMTLVML
jgi:hypothetical protein